jgi:hypothetical protein
MEDLSELARLAETLNEETDSYTESLSQLEKQLRQLNLGIECWVPLVEVARSGSPAGRETYVRILLGYAKTEEGWGFATKEVRVERGYYQGDLDCPYENEYDEGQAKSLLKSSRQLRLQAARRLGDLLEALKSTGESFLSSIQEAKKLAKDVGLGTEKISKRIGKTPGQYVQEIFEKGEQHVARTHNSASYVANLVQAASEVLRAFPDLQPEERHALADTIHNRAELLAVRTKMSSSLFTTALAEVNRILGVTATPKRSS